MGFGARKDRVRFFTDAGVEVPAVTAAQMHEIDRIAVEETGPNLYQMMENAGRDLALLAIELLGRNWARAKVMVLAGGGGNGGGGICAARHLANRNVNVRVCLANADRLREIPSFQLRIFRLTQGRETRAEELDKERVDLILDALIGYGLKSSPHGAAAELVQWANLNRAPTLSLDVPSGVDATTGETPGAFIRPQWTMTLALPKRGLLPERTGELFLADIGVPEGIYHRMGLRYRAPFGDRFWVRLTRR